MKKVLSAIALSTTLLSGVASADTIAWDAAWGMSHEGEAYTGGLDQPDGIYEPIQEFVFQYNSQSIVHDNDGNGLDVGDTITSFGGYGAGGFDAISTVLNDGTIFNSGYLSRLTQNQVGSFSPSPDPAWSEYGVDYRFTFYFNDLVGTYDGSNFIYNTGTIQFGVMTGSGFSNLFDLDVSFGGSDASNSQAKQVFLGDISNVQNGAGDDFSFTSYGLTQSLNDWLSQDKVYFNSNQTVTAGFADLASLPSDIIFDNNGFGLVAANHTGRMSFQVPEPTSIAILSLGLLGLAGVSRRRQAK